MRSFTLARSANESCSTTRNQQLSPFLRLPAEVRNQIYTYYFQSLVIDICAPTSHARKYSTCSYDKSGQSLLNYGANACALTRACRQLSAESRLLLFQFATLRVEDAEAFVYFLGDLNAAQLSCIKDFYSVRVASDERHSFNLRLYTREKSSFFMYVRNSLSKRL